MRTGPPLALEGWRALQQKLIRNEFAQLGGMELPSLPPDASHADDEPDHHHSAV